MRPTAGLVSRTGMYDGWPSINGSLGPMSRTVTDLAKLLDVMVGYDPEDPLTAHGVGKVPGSYTKYLDKNGLKGARIGVIRESIGSNSEPDSEDFRKVGEVFDKAISELKSAGAELVDPLVIPDMKALLAKRATGPDANEAFQVYFGRNPNAPFKSREEVSHAPDFAKLLPFAQARAANSGGRVPDPAKHYQYLVARDDLMTVVLKVMADNRLDAIVYKSVEHQPTLIKDGINPPYVSNKGVPSMNTFLVFVPVIAVPAGFTRDNLPAGITFQGRPYDEGTLIKLAYAYEQATHHRKAPTTVPALP
jgi:Asp-tRNA(Asn)/Glu-tRNA(Gln) amidotransferase A subunit family amidase